MISNRKRIVLLTDRLYYRIPLDIFHGIQKAVNKLDFDLIIFTGSILDSADPDKRQSNIIYQLARNEELDGIIVASNVISNETDEDRLKEFCRQYSDLPVISLGIAVEGIPSIIIDNYPGMYSIAEHLIQKHKKKDTVCLRTRQKS